MTRIIATRRPQQRPIASTQMVNRWRHRPFDRAPGTAELQDRTRQRQIQLSAYPEIGGSCFASGWRAVESLAHKLPGDQDIWMRLQHSLCIAWGQRAGSIALSDSSAICCRRWQRGVPRRCSRLHAPMRICRRLRSWLCWRDERAVASVIRTR